MSPYGPVAEQSMDEDERWALSTAVLVLYGPCGELDLEHGITVAL
jgi:hypothetical protein